MRRQQFAFAARRRADPIRVSSIAAVLGAFVAITAQHRTQAQDNVRDSDEIERAISAFAHSSNGGLIVTAAPLALVHRDLIVTLANRHRLCAVYSVRAFVTAGGLIYYGPDVFDLFRRAAGYVDRILKGEKPTDLPVQAPTKFEMVINIKTAKALGITVPPTLLARADEVIE